MIIEYIFASSNESTIDTSKLLTSTWDWLLQNSTFNEEDRKLGGIQLVDTLAQKCDGMDWQYVSEPLYSAWNDISEHVSESVTLYFVDDDGFPFRINLNPKMKTATYEMCPSRTALKKIKPSSKSTNFIVTQFSGRISKQKYQKEIGNMQWKKAGCEKCLIM